MPKLGEKGLREWFSTVATERYDDSSQLDLCSLCVVLTKNSDESQVAKALKIVEALAVNAATKGQEEEEEHAEKNRRIRTSKPAVKRQIELKGIRDLLLSLGFTMLEEKDEDEIYLVYPQGSSGPAWLESAMEEIRGSYRFIDTGTTERDSHAKKQAASAALARFSVQKTKSDESKARAAKMKFTAGMGGGEASTLYHRGGT